MFPSQFSFFFDSLPNQRNYEYNLNYILKVAHDLDVQYKDKLPELVKQYIEEFLSTFELKYYDDNEGIALKGVVA